MSPLTWGSRQEMSLPVAKTMGSATTGWAAAAAPQPGRARTTTAARAVGAQGAWRNVMFSGSSVRPVKRLAGGTREFGDCTHRLVFNEACVASWQLPSFGDVP